MTDSMSYLYTVGGYATLIGVGYVLYQVSTQKSRRRIAAAQAKSARAAQPEPKKDDKKKKQRLESFAAESQESTAKAAKPRVNAPETSTFLSNAQPNDTSDDGVDNREFAKQLSKAKKGTQFATKSDSGKNKEKSVKQSRANQISNPEENKPSAPSTTSADADADDDLSPVHSPEPAAADASGVSDMLEPVPSGPSVLRLTGTESKTQSKKPSKAPEQVETKKQRQNRKKAEAAKAAREEAEKERKALEEKQRRAARIADGRPAKNGVTVGNGNGNGNQSAWKSGSPGGASSAPAAKADDAFQLLDTFEAPAAEPAKPATKPVTKPVAPAAPTTASRSESTWISSLPSEEEQLEMLKDETDEWSTVKTKSSKKSTKKDTPVESGDDQVGSRPAPVPQQTKPSAANTSSKPSQSFGSFSALTTNDDPAEEAEEEWDV